MKGDPFYESQENHNLIGVANIFLECLFHDVTLDYHVPIISQQGEVTDFQILKLPSYLLVIGNTYQYFKIINALSLTCVQYCWSVVKSLLLVFRDCRLLESCTSRSLSWADLFLSVMATQQTRTLRTLIQPCPGELQWLSGYVSKVTVNRDIYRTCFNQIE